MLDYLATGCPSPLKFVAILLFLSLAPRPFAHSQISNFQHIIVMVQENRSPDNLFQGLCSSPYGKSSSCSTSPTSTQYDIQTSNWLDKTSSTGTRTPVATTLSEGFDLGHSHTAFNTECDLDTSTGVCRMDGAANNTCSGTCPTRPALQYVENSGDILDPYLSLVTQYGWANYMFQTNQGPSFPAHQFLFGGTSAPSATDDAAGTFASENMNVVGAVAGCIALSSTTVRLIDTKGESQKIYPCFEHTTLTDLLEDIGVSWKYYTPSAGSIWTAPDAINHICSPSTPSGGNCSGNEWTSHVTIKASNVLTDISDCKLADVSWVIPSGQDSDHPKGSQGGGPSWIASVVNAIGNNAKCSDGEKYWNNTAILVVWDDWGGWYDHVPPTILADPQGDYQYGFRVPFIVVSAYTSAGFISNKRLDFGSILRFIENNYGIEEGALNFADARSSTDLTDFFNLNQVPRVFTTVPSALKASYFLNDLTPPTDPDDD